MLFRVVYEMVIIITITIVSHVALQKLPQKASQVKRRKRYKRYSIVHIANKACREEWGKLHSLFNSFGYILDRWFGLQVLSFSSGSGSWTFIQRGHMHIFTKNCIHLSVYLSFFIWERFCGRWTLVNLCAFDCVTLCSCSEVEENMFLKSELF